MFSGQFLTVSWFVHGVPWHNTLMYSSLCCSELIIISRCYLCFFIKDKWFSSIVVAVDPNFIYIYIYTYIYTYIYIAVYPMFSFHLLFRGCFHVFNAGEKLNLVEFKAYFPSSVIQSYWYCQDDAHCFTAGVITSNGWLANILPLLRYGPFEL